MQGEEEVELQADFEVDPSQLPMIPKRGEPMKKRPFKHGDVRQSLPLTFIRLTCWP